MKNRHVIIIIALLLIFALDGLALAEKISGGSSPSFSPDGIGVSQQRRRRRRRRTVRRARTYRIVVPPDVAAPETQAAPVQQEMPVMSAPAPPPPAGSEPMDAPGMGRPAKKAGPRIKPPTVQIKPPTK